MSERMKIEGSCHCGKISFEADINPELVIICHCTDCQTISGAPFRANVPVKRENFVLRGQPKNYVKTADSGNKCVRRSAPIAVRQFTRRVLRTRLSLICASEWLSSANS